MAVEIDAGDRTPGPATGEEDRQAGDAAAARDQFAALLPVIERVSGAEHPDTLAARGNLACRTGEAGGCGGGPGPVRRAAALREQVSGTGHPSTLTTRAYLASWAKQAGGE